MPILVFLEMALQACCVYHAVRTGKPLVWVYVILFLPVVGGLVYLVAVVLPELGQSPAARQAVIGVQRAIDPERDYRRLAGELETVDSVDARRKLAEECLRLGRPGEAVRLYEAALIGIHKDDPRLMLALARARFADGDFAGCLGTLDDLKAANPTFESSEGHLLYARALEGAGRVAEALGEYEALVRYFAGEEARARYAVALQQAGEADRAREVFQAIARTVDKSPAFYRRAQREWYDLAKRNLEA